MLARKIVENTRRQQQLDERPARARTPEADKKATAEQIRLDDDSDVTFKRIAKLFQDITEAIRRRVSP